jgi:hypothetical protein
MEHYQCVKCYMPATSRERDVNTVEFFPKKTPFPEICTEDYLKQAATDILSILQKTPATLPYLAYGDETKNALVQIAQLLGQAAPPPPTPQLQTPDTTPHNPPAPLINPLRVPAHSTLQGCRPQYILRGCHHCHTLRGCCPFLSMHLQWCRSCPSPLRGCRS